MPYGIGFICLLVISGRFKISQAFFGNFLENHHANENNSNYRVNSMHITVGPCDIKCRNEYLVFSCFHYELWSNYEIFICTYGSHVKYNRDYKRRVHWTNKFILFSHTF